MGPVVLFTPIDRPEWFAEVADRIDMVILNLEDSCRAENREVARETVTSRDLDPVRTIVRVDPPEVEDYTADIDMLRGTAFRQAMLPKASSARQVDELVIALGGKTQVTTFIETPPGVTYAGELAQADGVVVLFQGVEDLVAGLVRMSSRFSGGEAALAPGHVHVGSHRSVAVYTRSHVHLAAAAHGKASLDSIYVNIFDAGRLAAEAADVAVLGFTATVCIHPGQVPTIRQAHHPNDKEVGQARQFLTEAEKNTGAFSFDGQTVDTPFSRQVRAIAWRATVTGQSHGR